MVLATHHEIILQQLRRVPIMTEHELAKAVAASQRRKDVDVIAQVGQWFRELRAEGLIWAGQLLNAGNQCMWAAVLTKKGREVAKAILDE